MSVSITVLVPFYKSCYFRKLLEALSRQSDSDFNIVVASDASELIARDICDGYKEFLNIYYFRFDQRLGHIDLAQQWNRALELVPYCDWIWVVPDDDLPSSKCIEEIRASTYIADEIGSHIIHIPVVTIDKDDVALSQRRPQPSYMCSGDFYLRQLRGLEAGLSLANSVYRRCALEEAGGFMSLPRAWGSDHATTLAVAAGGPVVIVPSAWLGFRMSGVNISSQTDDSEEKLQARIRFAYWLSGKVPEWYDENTASQIMRWFYLKSEYYIVNIWPFSVKMIRGLFQIASIAGVRLSALQRAGIIARGLFNFAKGLSSKCRLVGGLKISNLLR